MRSASSAKRSTRIGAGPLQRRGGVGHLLVRRRPPAVSCGSSVGVAEQGVGQRLEAVLPGDLGLGAPLRLVGQVDVLEAGLRLGRPDALLQGRVELALLADLLQHGGAAVLQLAQVAQPLLQRAELGVVEGAGGFLAVAGDERHRRAVVEQGHGRRDLVGPHTELVGDALADGLGLRGWCGRHGPIVPGAVGSGTAGRGSTHIDPVDRFSFAGLQASSACASLGKSINGGTRWGKRVTLQTIADAVGVSRATVSNAYNRPGRLSAELRARILAAAAEHGYAGPDPVARRLRTGRGRHRRGAVHRAARLRVLRSRLRGVPRGLLGGRSPRHDQPRAHRGTAGRAGGGRDPRCRGRRGLRLLDAGAPRGGRDRAGPRRAGRRGRHARGHGPGVRRDRRPPRRRARRGAPRRARAPPDRRAHLAAAGRRPGRGGRPGPLGARLVPALPRAHRRTARGAHRGRDRVGGRRAAGTPQHHRRGRRGRGGPAERAAAPDRDRGAHRPAGARRAGRLPGGRARRARPGERHRVRRHRGGPHGAAAAHHRRTADVPEGPGSGTGAARGARRRAGPAARDDRVAGRAGGAGLDRARLRI